MRGYHRVGKHFLALGALILAVVSVVQAIPAGPAAPAEAVLRAAGAAPALQRKLTLGDTSIDAPALWTSDAATPNLGLASVIAWTGTDGRHSLNVMRSSDGVSYGNKFTFAESSPEHSLKVALSRDKFPERFPTYNRHFFTPPCVI